MPDQTASHITEEIIKTNATFGQPDILHLDQGHNFKITILHQPLDAFGGTSLTLQHSTHKRKEWYTFAAAQSVCCVVIVPFCIELSVCCAANCTIVGCAWLSSTEHSRLHGKAIRLCAWCNNNLERELLSWLLHARTTLLVILHNF